MEGDAGSGSTTPGLTRDSCLDAIIIALNETCHGKKKSWYTSTKELQLASLEFCIACRNHQTLHLVVDAQVPRRLLAAADASPQEAKRLCWTRVPRLRARRVTWNISTTWELRNPIFAISDVDSLRFGRAVEGSLEAVAWPQRLETIFFSHLAPFNQPIDQVQWPVSLQRLVFGWSFNQRIEHVSWPDSLQVLAFGFAFNQPIDLVQWPASLQELEFEVRFNQRIEDVSWPDSLEILEFGREFNQPVEGVSWPDSLRVLAFGDHFNQPIEGVVWPASLKQIIFSVDSHFDHPIENVAWPTCLEKVVFGEIFNQPIARATFPASLQELSFAGEFNQPIEGVSWPNSIRRLELGASFNKPIDNVRWPASLREIKFGWGTEGDNRMVICSEFNQRIDNCVWPLSLRWLTLGDEFRQSLKGLGTWIPNLEGFRLLDYLDYDPGGGSLLRGIEWPKGLRQLTVFEDSDLDGVEIPSTVKVSYPLNDIHYRRARAGLAV